MFSATELRKVKGSFSNNSFSERYYEVTHNQVDLAHYSGGFNGTNLINNSLVKVEVISAHGWLFSPTNAISHNGVGYLGQQTNIARLVALRLVEFLVCA